LGALLIIFIKNELSKIDDKIIKIEQLNKADIVTIRSRSMGTISENIK
jgi:hypothetical protein